MSKPAFTPGPWRICTTGNLGNVIEGYSGRRLYEGDTGFRSVAMFQACCASERFDEQEANKLANARLIAAAPDMYEALNAAREQILHIAKMFPDMLSCDLPLRAIDAARAKAEGR